MGLPLFGIARFKLEIFLCSVAAFFAFWVHHEGLHALKSPVTVMGGRNDDLVGESTFILVCIILL